MCGTVQVNVQLLSVMMLLEVLTDTTSARYNLERSEARTVSALSLFLACIITPANGPDAICRNTKEQTMKPAANKYNQTVSMEVGTEFLYLFIR